MDWKGSRFLPRRWVPKKDLAGLARIRRPVRPFAPIAGQETPVGAVGHAQHQALVPMQDAHAPLTLRAQVAVFPTAEVPGTFLEDVHRGTDTAVMEFAL